MPTPLDPALFSAFQQFVARRGADFTMRLLEAVDDKLDPNKPNTIFRSIALLPLWSNLRYLSEFALENIVSCTERGLPFTYLVSCDPSAHSVGERVDVECYPGNDWEFHVNQCRERRTGSVASTSVQGGGKNNSAGALPPRGPRR